MRSQRARRVGVGSVAAAVVLLAGCGGGSASEGGADGAAVGGGAGATRSASPAASASASASPETSTSAPTSPGAPAPGAAPGSPSAPAAGGTPGDASSAALGLDSRITPFGAGPVRAGMTVREAEQAAGREFEFLGLDVFEGYCYTAVPVGLEGRLEFLVESPDARPVTDPHDGVIGRATAADYRPGAPHDPAPTEAGVAVGDPGARVRQVYGDAVLSQPHAYDPRGQYLLVDDPAGGDFRLRFEVGPGGTVEAIHGGAVGPVDYVEGCA